jgi:uncharacterized protein (TIGR00725 family)
MSRKFIGVIGAGEADGVTLQIAEEVGRLIARSGFILVCGGLSGVMEASARGAKAEGGTTVGILPQGEKETANPYIDIPVATGFGEGRNVVIARTADILIAISGGYGTLSEIAFALKMRKPVIGIATGEIPGVVRAETPGEAMERVCGLLARE